VVDPIEKEGKVEKAVDLTQPDFGVQRKGGVTKRTINLTGTVNGGKRR